MQQNKCENSPWYKFRQVVHILQTRRSQEQHFSFNMLLSVLLYLYLFQFLHSHVAIILPMKSLKRLALLFLSHSSWLRVEYVLIFHFVFTSFISPDLRLVGRRQWWAKSMPILASLLHSFSLNFRRAKMKEKTSWNIWKFAFFSQQCVKYDKVCF